MRICCSLGAEAKFLFQLSFDRQDNGLINAQGELEAEDAVEPDESLKA